MAQFHEHLRANDIEFAAKEVLGPSLAFDAKRERFVGGFDAEANSLFKRAYRKPFIVPNPAST